MDRDRVRQSRFDAVAGRQEHFPAVLPAQLVGQAAVLVQQAALLTLPLARPARVLRLRLGVQGVEGVRVVNVRIRVLRLRIDGLVGRREVRGLEVRVRCVGERWGARVGTLAHAAQLRQPGCPIAGAIVTILTGTDRNKSLFQPKYIFKRHHINQRIFPLCFCFWVIIKYGLSG